jgi:hypothetical protein
MRIRTLLLSALLGTLLPVGSAGATTYDELMDCVNTAIVQRASSKECPTIPRIRREIFDSLCRPQIEGYLQTERDKGQNEEWIGFMKESMNEYITDAIDRSAPAIQKRAFCD